jgi:hypothetical protein
MQLCLDGGAQPIKQALKKERDPTYQTGDSGMDDWILTNCAVYQFLNGALL